MRLAPVLDHSISKPLEGAPLVVLSLGMGVQSVTLLEMSARRDLPKIDAAIFADTGDEKRATYRYLDRLRERFPDVLIVDRRPGPSLSEMAVAVGEGRRPLAGSPLPPFYLRDPDGMAAKQCNADFKRDVVTRVVRRLLAERGVKLKRGAPLVEMWIGYTTDELRRLGPHRKKFIKTRWPLIELRMSRPDCKAWLEQRQIPLPPKSACVFCPYQGDEELEAMQDNEADDDWLRACAVDVGIRRFPAEGTAYVHRSCRPLAEVQFDRSQGDLFRFECEGQCGV